MIAVAFLILTVIFLTARYRHLKKQYEQDSIARSKEITDMVRKAVEQIPLQTKLDNAAKELYRIKTAEDYKPTLSPVAKRIYEQVGKKDIVQ